MTPLKQNFIKLMIVLFAVMVFLIMLSATLATSLQAAENDTVEMPVSINAVMVTLIDHSAHYIWDYGAMEREITNDEWRTVEYYAIQLAASGPMITLGGSGERDDMWAASPLWRDYAREMSKAAALAVVAAQDHDLAELQVLGDSLVKTCEACHDTFKPDTPTEGFTHMPDYDHLYHLLR